ncbi:MAG: IS5 family transposase [Methanomicrobiales archaeon]|nr:IS5 family transposase [Methanomicrobiales archaeon]MDI6877689.1 IS5 family transposase [Methanomicrobiales archaeon]
MRLLIDEIIPHFTTLHKFLQRLSSLWVTRIQKRRVSSLYQRGAVISVTAIDASGFTSAYASYYYSLRTGKTRKRFLKVSLAVDTTTHVILAAAMTRHPISDVRMARNLLKESHRTRKAACYVLDRGYDAESIHRRIREEMHAESLIPVRHRKRKRIHGRYRRELAKIFDEKTYHRRNLVETAFSVLKRTLGESLKVRRYGHPVKEIKVKILIYNLDRWIKKTLIIVISGGFYRAHLLLSHLIG